MSAQTGKRRLWPALTASLAAHGVILASLLSVKFVGPPLPVTEREYVQVSFARRPAPSPPPETAPPSAELPAPQAQEQEARADEVAEGTVERDAAAEPQIARSPPVVVTPSAEGAGPLTAAPEEPEGAGVALDGGGLRNQVTAFVRQQRDSYTQGFVEDCWIERQEGKRRECEGARGGDRGGDAEARAQVTALFQDLTRNQRHARLTAQLEARDEQLKDLAAAGGVLGALAVERRSIDREYRAYLNGNVNSAASNYVMSTFANTGNPWIMGSFLQFTCKKMPCIYEFTGFTVVKPKALEEAEAEVDTFPYTPTLFGRRK